MGVLHETSRQLLPSDMKGKTIKHAIQRAVNVIEFTFTDGSYVEIWSENGPYGIAVLEVDPNAKKGN